MKEIILEKNLTNADFVRRALLDLHKYDPMSKPMNLFQNLINVKFVAKTLVIKVILKPTKEFIQAKNLTNAVFVRNVLIHHLNENHMKESTMRLTNLNVNYVKRHLEVPNL